jgi:hypothetical protein
MSNNESEVNNKSLLSIIRMILSSSFSCCKYLLDPVIRLLRQKKPLDLGSLECTPSRMIQADRLTWVCAGRECVCVIQRLQRAFKERDLYIYEWPHISKHGR